MNTFAIDFLNNVKHGEIVNEEVKQKFTESVKDIVANNFYVAYSHSKGFHISNKKPEKLDWFKNNLEEMIMNLFVTATN